MTQNQIPLFLIKFAADKMGSYGRAYYSHRKAGDQITKADPNYIEAAEIKQKNLTGRFTAFLNDANAHNPQPMAVFGRLCFDIAEDSSEFREELQNRLKGFGLYYAGEGRIEPLAFIPYNAGHFLKILQSQGADGIRREFARLGRNIAADPLAAALNAAAALEASCKFYLGDGNYQPKAALKALAGKTLNSLKFSAEASAGPLKAGLENLCAAIEIFRNKYSAAHGRGQTELLKAENIGCAEIELYIQTAQMLCFYILSQNK